MTATVVKGLYLALWVAIATAGIYAAIAAGHPFWLGAALTFALFFFVNGSLAYFFRARQLRLQGEQPPPFLVYLFRPAPLQYKSRVAVPRPLRLLLGVVIFIGGAFFVLIDVLMLTNLDFSRIPHPVGAVIMLFVLPVLGLAIAYVGFRLMVMKGEDPLFKRTESGEKKSS
jgi:hypothetical protein